MSSSVGPLAGLRVVELASEWGAFAGKMLGDLGADVILVEPPGGHGGRRIGPFVDGRGGVDDLERSLWWWHYQTSKQGVVIDLDTDRGVAAFRMLVGTADIVLEGEPRMRLGSLGLDHTDFRPETPRLIWVSVTPFGRDRPESDLPSTDLTLMAGGGPVWNCGYDDHSLAPVRPSDDQAMQMAGVAAVTGALAAVVHRGVAGTGQHIDVSVFDAVNVVTESGTFVWNVAGQTVHRQTGRHAAVERTRETQVQAADGNWVTTGFPPRKKNELERLIAWMRELSLDVEFDEFFFLEMGVERGGVHSSEIPDDVLATNIFGASRDAITLLASRLDASAFFRGAQDHGIAVGIVYRPDQLLDDPHLADRGFFVPVPHDDLGRTVTYPGAPYRFGRSPWTLTRAPHLGEHQCRLDEADG